MDLLSAYKYKMWQKNINFSFHKTVNNIIYALVQIIDKIFCDSLKIFLKLKTKFNKAQRVIPNKYFKYKKILKWGLQTKKKLKICHSSTRKLNLWIEKFKTEKFHCYKNQYKFMFYNSIFFYKL